MKKILKTFYKWVLTKKDEFTKETLLVRWGIVEEPVEVNVEKIFPNLDYCGDRNLSEMQKFADEILKDRHYTFTYEELKIDFSDLID
jgi:hypothetical protein